MRSDMTAAFFGGGLCHPLLSDQLKDGAIFDTATKEDKLLWKMSGTQVMWYIGKLILTDFSDSNKNFIISILAGATVYVAVLSDTVSTRYKMR